MDDLRWRPGFSYADFEREFLEDAIMKNHGNLTLTARGLRMGLLTLRRRVARYDIPYHSYRHAGSKYRERARGLG